MRLAGGGVRPVAGRLVVAAPPLGDGGGGEQRLGPERNPAPGRLGAALALRALGAPGRALLGRGSQSTSASARDSARQVLDLPEGAEPFLP